MKQLTATEISRLSEAVQDLEERFLESRLEDENVDGELRAWLDGPDEPLNWDSRNAVTPDEWFFVTTLYGEMTLEGQRTHIRKFFPTLFVGAADRDTRNFVPGMPEYGGLRSGWMAKRLAKMAEVLRRQNLTMSEYAESLRELEKAASPDDPMPALKTIVRDHQASGWKTLSVFVRDCVGGNAFPIDSRVAKELEARGLPVEEHALVSACLEIGTNPRQVARMFYQSGGLDG